MNSTNRADRAPRKLAGDRTHRYTREVYPVELGPTYLACSLPMRMANLLLEIADRSRPVILGNEWIVGWQTHAIPSLLAQPEYLLTKPEIRRIDRETGIFTQWADVRNWVRDEGLAMPDYGKGHMILDYKKVLNKGFSGIKEEIEGNLSRERDPQKQDYGHAMLTSCAAAVHLADKYAAHARELARVETDALSRDRLERIAAVCDRVPRLPAESFQEALQAVWFTQLLFNLENGIQASSFGRMDQYLYPYYQTDRSRGVPEEALRELLFSFLIKICYYLDFTYQSNMPITVGGVDGDGRDAGNELTRWFLEFIEEYRLPEPKITLRVHDGTPKELLDYTVRILGFGTGSPQLVNDDYIIPMLQELGLSRPDTLDYGMVGCTGPSAINGKELGWESGGGFVNLAKILENTLDKIALPMEQFDDLIDRYKQEISGFLDSFIEKINVIDRYLPRVCPTPFQSSLMSGCIESLSDMNSGCVPYNFTHYPGAGLANVANSLIALKKMVFEEGRLTLQEFITMLKDNYEGYEKWREYIRFRLPKFGNDDKEVDDIASDIAGHYLREVRRHTTGRNGCCRGGLASYTHNLTLGERTGALPDGNKQGEPLASGFAPSQGTDRTSPTAIIHSVSNVTRIAKPTNVAFTFSLAPSFFSNAEMIRKVSDLLRIYFAQGGMQIQVNVIDVETLKAAMKEPERYGDLIIRVCGYSAYFVDLSPKIQEEILSRYEYC